MVFNEPGEDLQRLDLVDSEGFRYLLAGRYEDALEVFRKAEETYPGDGGAAEIMRLLAGSLPRMDDPATEMRVLSDITENLAWKSQKVYVQDLRQHIKSLMPFQQQETSPRSP